MVSLLTCETVSGTRIRDVYVLTYVHTWSKATGRTRPKPILDLSPHDTLSQAFPVINVFHPRTIKNANQGRPGTEANIFVHVDLVCREHTTCRAMPLLSHSGF